ncbi:insulin-like growth factor-binding protein complex acid labile subunit [Drosophila teissieri]|uniref:insulin-like growth factor-binding protein complex acid labile subunit n=1 Tax=Drosophila teissieri TaxID=7243 RepID=UPI001CBA3163|nr:insulin-like growth factor-binding protein complex acid labile subunit [Drosophila teissieri]
MTSLVYTVFHLASLQCSVRPEISPCTCETGKAWNHVELSCEKLESFNAVVDSLANKLNADTNIDLKITHSQLDDLEMRSFTDMNFNLYKLRMQWNSLKSLPEVPFRGLSNVTYLSIGDNDLDEIPKHALSHMPSLLTLDIGRCKIRSVQQEDFRGIQRVTNLILVSNIITRLDRGSFPKSLLILHLGRNQLESLNGSLHDLHNLESLFINANNITSLDDELPDGGQLRLLMAHNNRLERLPANMAGMHSLETVHIHCNQLRSFDRVLRNAVNLSEVMADNNELEYLAQDEFASCSKVETLQMGCNHIKSLNSSLLPILKLKNANFSFNDIEEFSMAELHGLRSLKTLQLSSNRIQRLLPDPRGVQDLMLVNLDLDNNRIDSLNGALAGLGNLRILNLAGNRLEHLQVGDFDGMIRLDILDLTGNQLAELKPLEMTLLPSLKILKVAYNNITKLEQDFKGLPVLCQANLTNNQISAISSELVTNTRCKNHNVPGKLEIHLDDNPIMCDVGLNELCRLMAVQEARIRGRSQCFENDQEVCTVLPMLYNVNLPIMVTNLKLAGREVPKPMVQVIMPSLIKANNELLPPLIATLGNPVLISTALVNPVISPLPPPLLLATTTPPPPLPLPVAPEEDKNETTTANPVATNNAPETTTTTSTTTTTTTTETSSQVASIELITTTAPTTTTTSTTTPKPNETLPVIVELQDHNPPDTPVNQTDVGVAQDEATALVPPVVLDPLQQDLERERERERERELERDLDHEAVAKTEYETVEYIPNLVQPPVGSDALTPPPSKANALEEDSESVHSNSVHAEYPHAAQSLQIPEEPPEE